MSELTPCNYCSLERIKKSLVGDAYVLMSSERGNGLIDVFVVTSDAYGVETSRRWVSAFAALTTRCVC